MAVFLIEHFSSTERFDFALTLAAELSKTLELPVDVQVLTDTSLEFQFRATTGEMLLSGDEEKRLSYLEGMWPPYFDFQYFIKQNLLDLLT